MNQRATEVVRELETLQQEVAMLSQRTDFAQAQLIRY